MTEIKCHFDHAKGGFAYPAVRDLHHGEPKMRMKSEFEGEIFNLSHNCIPSSAG